jgi:nitroreductase
MIADCRTRSRFINDPKEEMDLFTAIETRASAGRVSAPGPTSEDLARILAAAGLAPDHGRM